MLLFNTYGPGWPVPQIICTFEFEDIHVHLVAGISIGNTGVVLTPRLRLELSK